MAQTITEGHIGTLSVMWKKPDGTTGRVDGETTWASTDPAVGTIVGDPGNTQVANWHTVTPGTCTWEATADADLGEGVRPVSCLFAVEVISGEVVGGEMHFVDLGPGSPSEGGPSNKPA